MSTYTAQNYGAGKQDRIRKGVTQCILMSVSFSIVMGLVNIFFGGNLASLFVGNSEPQVLENARTYLSISGSLYWSLALLFIYRFTLQGLGNRFHSHLVRCPGTSYAYFRRTGSGPSGRIYRHLLFLSAGMDRCLHSSWHRLLHHYAQV